MSDSQHSPLDSEQRKPQKSQSTTLTNLLIGVAVVAVTVGVSVARLRFGLGSMGQTYASILIGLAILAYCTVTAGRRPKRLTFRSTDPSVIYNAELTDIRRQAQQYSPDDVERFKTAKFTQGDAQTFRSNLTDARTTVMTWEFAVRQSGYLTLVENATHGLESAKKLIEDIRLHPRKMLKFGDFLYTDLPNIATLCVEFKDLADDQSDAQKSALPLIKKLSAAVTRTYEKAQAQDVQEAVKAADPNKGSQSATEKAVNVTDRLTQMSPAGSGSPSPADSETADLSTSNSDFDRLQQILRNGGQWVSTKSSKSTKSKANSASASSRNRKGQKARKSKIPRQLDSAFTALVVALFGFVWVPRGVAIFTGIIAIILLLAVILSTRAESEHDAKVFIANDGSIPEKKRKMGGSAVHSAPSLVVLLTGVAALVFACSGFAGYGQAVSNGAHGTEADGYYCDTNDIDGDCKPDNDGGYIFTQGASKQDAKTWTIHDVLKLTVSGADGSDGTNYSDIMRTFGNPFRIDRYKKGGAYDRTYAYYRDPNQTSWEEGEINLNFSDGNLYSVHATGVGTRLPFSWTKGSFKKIVTLKNADGWRNATTFKQIEDKYGDPNDELSISGDDVDSSGKEYVSMIYSQTNKGTGKSVDLIFMKVNDNDFRLSSWTANNFDGEGSVTSSDSQQLPGQDF